MLTRQQIASTAVVVTGRANTESLHPYRQAEVGIVLIAGIHYHRPRALSRYPQRHEKKRGGTGVPA